MEKNKKLWTKARIALCNVFLSIINEKKYQLITFKITTDSGAKTIELNESQARQVINIIKSELHE